MKLDQQQQAQRLYFQTDLSKSEIAENVSVSRRTLHYWVRHNNWDRLKASAQAIPSFLAENCYQVLGNLTEHLLSEDRIGKPVTCQEANSIYKLTLTIGKLKNRQTLNESMEMFQWFTDQLSKQDPSLAEKVVPHIEQFVSKYAAPNYLHAKPAKMDPLGFIPSQDPEKLARERQLDDEDMLAWFEENLETMKTYKEQQQPQPTPANSTPPKPQPTQPRQTQPQQPQPPIPTPDQMKGQSTKHQTPFRDPKPDAPPTKLPRILQHAA